MSFIAITYGYNQYSIFNTNVSTFPLLDNIVSTCLDDIVNLLNSKLPLWEEKIHNYNTEEEQVKKSIKRLETDKLSNDEKGNESSKPRDGLSSYNEGSNNNNNNNKKSSNNNPKANTSKYFIKLSFIMLSKIKNQTTKCSVLFFILEV